AGTLIPPWAGWGGQCYKYASEHWPHLTGNGCTPQHLERIPKSVKRFSEQDARLNKELERRSDTIRSKCARRCQNGEALRRGEVASRHRREQWLFCAICRRS